MSFLDLSPSPDRVGRACAWVQREDGLVLMTGLDWGGWTLPGGGIMHGETPEAARREAWEEAGVHGEVCGEAVWVDGGKTLCVPLRLTRLDPSPEGRPVRWVDPAAVWWASDRQLHTALCAWGHPAPARPVAGVVRRLHRLGWQLRAEFRRGLRA